MVGEESEIIINGITLSEEQAMVVRAALLDFSRRLDEDDFMIILGPIADLYKEYLHEVLKMILRT